MSSYNYKKQKHIVTRNIITVVRYIVTLRFLYEKSQQSIIVIITAVTYKVTM